MDTGDPAPPEELDSAGAGKTLSEAEQLAEQGYRTLLSVASAQPRQALELCGGAIELFKRAIEAAGDDQEQRILARQGLAAAYSQLGHQQRYQSEHKAAVISLSEALKINPTLSEDYFYRAQSELKLGDEQAARKDFTEYLRRGEDDYLRIVAREQNAALVLKAEDNTAKAGHWQQEGMRLNAEAANAMHPRGEEEPAPARAVALYNKALDAFSKARESNPKEMMTQIGMITALSEQAECYLQMEEYDLAIDNYNRAYALRPLAQYIFKRGEAYRAGGYTAQARADFERYLKEGNDRSLKIQAKNYLEEKPRPEVEV